MTLSEEQRRALALLANGDRRGVTQTLLGAHGFGVPMIAAARDNDAGASQRGRQND
jgi:hypothetical protein